MLFKRGRDVSIFNILVLLLLQKVMAILLSEDSASISEPLRNTPYFFKQKKAYLSYGYNYYFV